MKSKLLLLLVMIVSSIGIQAQDISSIKEPGVYYLNEEVITKILPLNMEGVKMKGVFSKDIKSSFKGEKSNNVISDSIPVLYIKMLPYNVQTINNFVMTYLEPKKGVRTVASFKASAFGTKSTAEYIEFDFEKIDDAFYKITPKQALPSGCYGVYYNHGGHLVGQIYDFDIK